MDDIELAMESLSTFDEDDLRRWADVGSRPRPLEAMLRTAARASLLALCVGPSHGRAVEEGLCAADVAAALALASTEARDRRCFEAKRLALRVHASDDAQLVGVMVRAALAHEADRLGLCETGFPSVDISATVRPHAGVRAIRGSESLDG